MDTLSSNEVAGALALHDLPILRSHQPTSVALLPAALIALLAAESDGRYSEALIALFLRHPDYAAEIPAVVAQLPAVAAQRLKHLYTAAVYLQHLWEPTLQLFGLAAPALPNIFANEWELAAPTIHFGELGLRQLAARFEAESGFAWRSSYDAAVTHLVTAQLMRHLAHG